MYNIQSNKDLVQNLGKRKQNKQTKFKTKTNTKPYSESKCFLSSAVKPGVLREIQKRTEFWDCCFRENVVSHAPQKEIRVRKRKYLFIWELLLLKHAFCGQEREARSADSAAKSIPQAGVLHSIGIDFAPQHGSNSSPAHGNGGLWFSLKQMLPAFYRPFRWKTQLPNGSWNFYKVWLRKRTLMCSFFPFSLQVRPLGREVDRSELESYD